MVSEVLVDHWRAWQSTAAPLTADSRDRKGQGKICPSKTLPVVLSPPNSLFKF
jgi:hypothetical protein